MVRDSRRPIEAPPSGAEGLPAGGGVPELLNKVPSHLADGMIVGRYRVDECLGSGGTGQIYRARDLESDRDVALKFVPAELSLDPSRLDRFQVEACSAAALDRRGICALHDIGMHEGTPYLVHELLEGASLKTRLADGPIGSGLVIEIGIQVCTTLEAVHERGIIHRDINPSNLFLTNGGQAKILDFGVAKYLASRPVERRLAEEVRDRAFDAGTDLQALGATLYELATGGPPPRPAGPEAMVESDAAGGPLPPRKKHPAISRGLERVVLKAMSSDPSVRYGCAALLRQDLERLRPRQVILRWFLASCAAAALIVVGIAAWGRVG